MSICILLLITIYNVHAFDVTQGGSLMGRQVLNRQEAVIRQNVILRYLESNEMTYDDLLTALKKGYGIDIGYKMFAKLLKNQSNWRLTYAFVLCDYLNMQLNELFELKECV